MPIVSNDLLFPSKLEDSISKKVTFPVKSHTTRNRYSQAYCAGLVKFIEVYSLSYRDLIETEFTDLETLFRLQDTGQVISWTPPNESSARLFYPPESWDINQKIRFRGGASETLYDVSFELRNFY